MLSDKMIEKIAASDRDVADLFPNEPGSFLEAPSPSVMGTVGRSAISPAYGALWALTKHLGSKGRPAKNLRRRTAAAHGHAPSWLRGQEGQLTDFRNKLMKQERRLSQIIEDRFDDRGDGTYYDKVLGKPVSQSNMSRSVGHLRMMAERERQKWWTRVSQGMNSGKYVWDPVTRTQRLVGERGNTPGDQYYDMFRNTLRRKAAGRGPIARTLLPYKMGGELHWSRNPAMSEADIRRMYLRSLT